MTLDGSRSEVLSNSSVDVESSHHNLLIHTTDLLGEATSAEVVAENGGEDRLHSVLIREGEGDGVEMALETRGDYRFTTSRGSHSTDRHTINQVSEGMGSVFTVVPASLIEPLSEDFDWGHGTRRLSVGHVKIINKDDSPVSEFRSEVTSLSTLGVHLEIDQVLDHVSLRLGRESTLDCDEFVLRKLVEKYVLNVGGLSSSSRSNEQSRDLVHNVVLDDVRVSDRVDSGDHNILHDGAFGELILFRHVSQISPGLPGVISRVIDVIVDSSSVEASVKHLAREFLEVIESSFTNSLEVLIELLSALSVTRDADRPDARVDESVVDSLCNYLLV